MIGSKRISVPYNIGINDIIYHIYSSKRIGIANVTILLYVILNYHNQTIEI